MKKGEQSGKGKEKAAAGSRKKPDRVPEAASPAEEEKPADGPEAASPAEEEKPEGPEAESPAEEEKPLSLLPVSVLRGVGHVQESRLQKLGIATVQDLLFHLPVSYEDRTRLDRLSPDIFLSGERVFLNLAGKFLGGRMIYGRKTIYRGQVQCPGGILTLVIFNARLPQVRVIDSSGALLLYGEVKPGSDGGYEMIQPDIQCFPSAKSIKLSDSLTPNYPLTEGITQRFMRKIAGEALELLRKRGIEELIPDDAMRNPVSLTEALLTLHAPPPGVTDDMVRSGSMPAQRRLIAEELAAHHISILEEKARNRALRAPAFSGKSELEEKFLASLPFSPTKAQERVTGEIAADLMKEHPMMRLVQGDVGSGKTLVAARAALKAISAGYQVALMAPTELLAEQHARTFRGWLSPLGIRVTFLSGSLTAKERRSALEDLVLGRTGVTVGTHALFQNDVVFRKLGLIIIDEQHRFGVAQRLALLGKGEAGGLYPHQLVMTATPIPRTLAMTAEGSLDISVIDELPPGRTPVTTAVFPEGRREEIALRVRERCLEGAQAYWVCTLVEESEVLECEAAETTAEYLQGLMPDVKVGLVHGRMSPQEKDEVMSAFKGGEIGLLVATTVIEVGVDVPNATIMVIDNAERLGLSQLHQLRGRVGRGSGKSFCLLIHGKALSAVGKERLRIMRETNDGFVIAEKDLELRGPGEVLGTRQAGTGEYRIADLARDADLIPEAIRMAEIIYERHRELAEPLRKRWISAESGIAMA